MIIDCVQIKHELLKMTDHQFPLLQEIAKQIGS